VLRLFWDDVGVPGYGCSYKHWPPVLYSGLLPVQLHRPQSLSGMESSFLVRYVYGPVKIPTAKYAPKCLDYIGV